MKESYQNIYPQGTNINGFQSPGTQPPYTNFPNQNQSNFQTDPYQYAYNILNNNPNQIADFYMSYPDSVEWRDRVFSGRIIHATREYTLLRNEQTGEWYVLPSIYLNYVIFNEELNM